MKETTRRRDVLLVVVGTSMVKETARQRDVFLPVVGTFVKRRPQDEEMTIDCDRDLYCKGDNETKRCLVACVGELLW